ncbi:MAG TPA: repressor LexA [Gammaproteobacteria bacterium]|nr:repressor LexA [Gammaproteobacteria bacterium]
MRTEALTRKQQQTLDFIQRYIARHATAPKLREIAEGIGIRSRGVAHRYVQALSDAGYIASNDGNIRLLADNPHRIDATLPLLGKIAAGKPIEAIPGEDQLDLRDFFGSNNYAVRVQGDSMIEAGIYDGDTVIIEFRETAENGDIVIALIDECEATLKYFQRSHKGRYIKLIPANKDMEPMVYEAERVRIQGVVIGQIRRY